MCERHQDVAVSSLFDPSRIMNNIVMLPNLVLYFNIVKTRVSQKSEFKIPHLHPPLLCSMVNGPSS